MRRSLQTIVAILALVPVFAGAAGVLFGAAFLGMARDPPVDLDSHLRFLSGVFLAVGLAWLSCVPDIGRKTARFRLLAALTVAGGLARALSLIVAGMPSLGHVVGLGLELVAVPLLTLWQAKVAAHASTSR